MTRSQLSFISRVKLGIAGGIAVGLVLSAWALFQYMVQGPQLFTRLGASVGTVLQGYALMGILSGATVGIAWPLTRWAIGSMIVGFLGAFPVWLVVLIGVSDGALVEIVRGSFLLSLAFGPAVGFAGWYQARRYRGG